MSRKGLDLTVSQRITKAHEGTHVHPKRVELLCAQGTISVDVIPLVGNQQH